MSRGPMPGRVVAVMAAMAALAVASAGCGDSAEEPAVSGGPPKATSDAAPVGGGTPQEQIKAAYEAYIDAAYDDDVATACDGLSPRLQEQLARRLGKGKTCEQMLKGYFDLEVSPNRPYIVRYKVNGNRATIFVKTKNSKVYKIPYVKLDGTWKADGGFNL